MTILDKIFAAKREVASARSAGEWEDARLKAQDAAPARGFLHALQQAMPGPALIAEVKKASPVMGETRADFDPVAIAQAYERVGAHALSVLTDVPFFKGSNEILVRCREATNLPVLRKDFTTCAFDVYEARAIGADAILLIVNGLEPAELADLGSLAKELSMDVIVEAHTAEEADLALAKGAEIVGINNRDLATFETQIDVSEAVLPSLAGKAFLVSESALHSHADVTRVAAAGAQAVLIGTAFCQADDIEAKVREVMGW